MKKDLGFSLLETMIVLSIMGIIFAIVITSYNTAKSKKSVEVTIDAIDSRLEEAKSNALSGKAGKDWGVKFNTIGYVLFSGNAFNNGDITNSTTSIDSNLKISTSLSGAVTSVIFARLTGVPNVTGSISVTDTNTSTNVATATIGILGDISVIK